MFGNLPRKAATAKDIDQLIEKSLRLRIFENVEMSSDLVKDLDLKSPEYQRAAALTTIGTDFAVNLGRELRCVRIPVTPKAVAAAAKFLNSKNNRYYLTGEKYEWSSLSNNCAHLSLNTTHAMGMNGSEKTDQMILKQVFDISIPANTYLNYADRAVLNEVSNRELSNSHSLKTFGYHPAQVGSLMLKYDAYPESAMFRTDDLTALTAPRKNVLKMFATTNSYDKHLVANGNENMLLLENAKTWAKKYRSLLKKLPPEENNLRLRKYLEAQLDLSMRIVR